SKFTREFDEVFRSEGIRVIKAPVRAPKARAHAERWVGIARRECLDRLLIVGRRHLNHVLAAYTRHYNEHRPHRALAQLPPTGARRLCGEQPPADVSSLDRVCRRDLLGGLIHEYRLAAYRHRRRSQSSVVARARACASQIASLPARTSRPSDQS